MKKESIEIERLPLSPEAARRQWSHDRRKNQKRKKKRRTKTNMDKYCRKTLIRKCPHCGNAKLKKQIMFTVDPETLLDKRSTFYKCEHCGGVWQSTQTIKKWVSPGSVPAEKLTAKQFKEKIELESLYGKKEK